MASVQLRPWILSLVMAAVVLPASAFVDGDKAPSCQQIDEWIATNRNVLPRSYDELVRFPLPYRKRIFAELEPDVRASLWQTHLERWLTNDPTVTEGILLRDDQRDLIVQIQAALRPEIYTSTDRSWLPVEQIQETFTDVGIRQRVFARLGPPEARWASSGTAPIRSLDWARSTFVRATTVLARDCECDDDYVVFPDCPYSFLCIDADVAGISCTPVRGCGYFYVELCKGICCFQPDPNKTDVICS
jgi:hypothetical protein